MSEQAHKVVYRADPNDYRYRLMLWDVGEGEFYLSEVYSNIEDAKGAADVYARQLGNLAEIWDIKNGD